MARTKKTEVKVADENTNNAIKKPRKTIEDKIAALEKKLEALKNKPSKELVKTAVKVIKKMNKVELEAFIEEHK